MKIKRKIAGGNVLLASVFIVLLVGMGFLFLRQLKANQKLLEERKNKFEMVDENFQESFLKVVVEDSNTKKVPLNNVSGNESTGKVYVLRRDGILYVVAYAELSESESGYYYEGWLGKRKDDMNYYSLGQFQKKEGFPHFLEFAGEGEFPDYGYFLLTLEKNDDSIPEKILLEANIN